MSLILDALKKLEQEKAARKDRELNIAAEILKPERLQPLNKKRTAFLAVASVGGVLAVLAGIVLLGRTDVRQQSSPPAAPSTVSQTTMPAPLPPAAAAPQNQTAFPTAQPRADTGKGELFSPPGKSAKTTAAVPLAASRPRPVETAANKSVDAPENSTRASGPLPRVSGIVWQEERSARRAFVNGIMASEGSVIDGAKVVEIYPVRIRFSKGEKLFDVSIEKNP